MTRERWVLSLERADAPSLSPIRLETGVEAHVRDGTVWVRGPLTSPSDDAPAHLRSLPATGRFRCGTDGKLRPWDGRLPVGALPSGPWLPLAQVVRVTAPTPLGPARAETPIPLRLVPASRPRDAELLLTDAATFNGWATAAPQMRLDRLRVAYAADGRVLVCGAPLPPLPGLRLWEEAGIAAPCGHEWSPPVPAPVLGEVFDLLPGELIVLDGERSERLSAACFLPATRAVARASPGEGS